MVNEERVFCWDSDRYAFDCQKSDGIATSLAMDIETTTGMSRRVRYVIGSLAVGGAERHVVAVASGLRMRGWAVEVFVLDPRGPLSQVLAAAGVPIKGPLIPAWLETLLGRRSSSRLHLLLSAIWLFVLMLRDRRGIVHFFLPASYILGGLIACLVGARPRIMSRRSLNRYQSKSFLYRKLEHFLHPRMDFLVGNSRAVADELEIEAKDLTPVRLIYNGIDSLAVQSSARDETRRELGIDASALVMVIVANLIPYKGHADLLKALSVIKDSLPDHWRLLCVGRDDGTGAALRTLAATLRIDANVLWLGSRMDVSSCLVAADIGISSSHEEGFSNAVLEGMLAGLPMVVTNVGGNPEAVVDAVTGYVVPPHSPQELGKAVLRVAQDTRRGEMGARGKARVLQTFSMSACLDAYEALYRDAVSMREAQ